MPAHNLTRVKVIRNPNYKASGLKSYVYLLNKWGFDPTKPGPYYQTNRVTQQGSQSILRKFGVKKGGHATTHRVLAKKVDDVEDTSGNVGAEDQQNDSMYLCEVSIGTPAQTLKLDFDTGSSDLWVWSTELPKATQLAGKKSGHVIFDPSKSSTWKKSTGQTWEISYGDSSSASGDVGTDVVSIGGLSIQAQAVELAKKMSTQFVESTGDGLLGLAWGNINTVKPKAVQTPVENMITQSDIPKDSELFTAYLGSWRDTEDPDKGESFYTFGYIDQDVISASGQEIHYTPVDNSEGFWMFDSTSAVVNGKTIQLSGNTAIADTGTTLALVSDSVVEAIYDAIPGAKYDAASQGYIFPTTVTADQLPAVSVDVGGKQFTIQPEDLAFAEAKTGYWYGGIQSRGTMTFDILGDTFLKSVYAIFDQGNTQFGVVPRIQPNQNLDTPSS